MVNPEEARASLAEITDRRRQVLEGTTRGRHRGWDAAGLLVVVGGFAAMDLPAPSPLRLSLLLLALVVAVFCFTRAGLHSRVVLHRSQMTRGFWALMGGTAIVFAALAFVGLRLLDQIDFPLPNTLFGVVLVATMAATHPLYRALLVRFAA